MLLWDPPCSHVGQGFVGLVGTGPGAGMTELPHGQPRWLEVAPGSQCVGRDRGIAVPAPPTHRLQEGG